MRGFLCLLTTLATFGLFIWIILSYVVSYGRLPWGHPVRKAYDALSNVIDPILAPIRRVMPPLRTGAIGLDLSPIILFVGLIIIRSIIGC